MEYWLFMRVVSRRKWLILGLIALTMIATIVSILIFPVPVEARTRILFNFRTPRDVDVFEQSTYSGPRDTIEHYNFVALFSSTSILEEAIDVVSKEVNMEGMTPEKLQKKSKATLNVIRVGGQDEKTSIIEYVVTLQNPDRTVALCNAVSDVVIKRYKKILTDAVVKSREYLEGQVLVSRQELEAAQANLEKFYIDNPEFTKYLDRSTYSSETVRSESSIIDLGVKYATLESQMKAVEDDISFYTNTPNDQIPVSIQASPLINDLRSELIKIKLERDKLLTRYTEDYPEVIKYNTNIGEIRNSLYSTYLTLLNEKLVSLKAQRKEISSSMASLESDQNQASVEYNDFSIKRLEFDGLVRDLEVAEDTYSLMRGKLSEAQIREDEARNRYTLEIIDKPMEAKFREDFYFDPVFKIIFAFLGSVIFSLILVFLMDYFEVRYRSTTDVSMVVDLPILGEVPEYRSGK